MPQSARKNLHGAAYQASHAQCFKAMGKILGGGKILPKRKNKKSKEFDSLILYLKPYFMQESIYSAVEDFVGESVPVVK